MRAAAAAVAAAALWLGCAGAARAVTYGIADAPEHFASCQSFDDPCSSLNGVSGYWNTPAFAALVGSAHPLGAVRIMVKYDAVATWNGSSGCRLSDPYLQGYTDRGGRVHPASQSWLDLYYSLSAAYADHLAPLVAIVGYTTADAVKSYSDGSAASAASDPAEPDPTTAAGYWDYYCGVRGILNGIAAHLPASAWPHQWEPWNEPNGGCTYLNNHCTALECAALNQPAGNYDPAAQALTCSATGRGDSGCEFGAADGGAAKAGCLWILARNAIAGFAGHANDTIAAGTFSFPSAGYLRPYAALLASQGYRPPVYSVHDYGDPTASGWLGMPMTGQLQAFDQALGQDPDVSGVQQLWVTESGIDLTDHDQTYGEFDSIPCIGGAGLVPPHTLGACVEGKPDAQLSGAQGFFALPFVTGGPPVSALYWYQWTGAAGSWDSGLQDPSGQNRAAYCVWIAAPPSECPGSPQSSP